MVPQIALVLWILISLALFAIYPPRRAFLLTYVVGLLFLPVEITDRDGYHIGSIVFTQSLRIEKFTACHIGAILGTLFFAPHVIRRYRFQWLDLAFGIVVLGQFLTSVVNDLGAKDGFSGGMQILRDYLPIIVLTRLYITTFDDLLEAMRVIIGGAFIYSGICVWEWRFSPQLHTNIYGYFQHSFDEFMRYDHFRPVGFLRHAIELSSFMALAAILAGWLTWKKMFKPLWGFIPPSVVVGALLIGLATTMTMSGYCEYLLCAAMLGSLLFFRSRWVVWVLPILAIAWMLGRYTGTLDATSLLDVTHEINPGRAVSMEYRLQAEQLNLKAASEHLLLGQGASHGAVRTEDGNFVLALDAEWLINLVFFGLVGLGGWFLLWSSSIFETFRRWWRLSPEARSMAAVVCVLIGAQFIDFLFNDFPSRFLLLLNVGLISAIQHYRPVAARRPAWMPERSPLPGEIAGVGEGGATS